MSEAWMILWKHYLTRPGLASYRWFYIKAKQRVLFSLARVCKLSAHPQHDFPRKKWSKFKINVWDVKSSCSLEAACGGGSSWWRHAQALPHSLCQTGPRKLPMGSHLVAPPRRWRWGCQFSQPCLKRSPSVQPMQAPAWSLEIQWQAVACQPCCPDTRAWSPTCVGKRRHWKHHFMPGLDGYFINLIHWGGRKKEEI